MGLSALACAGTVMILHINPFSKEQGCASCAFLVLVPTAGFASVGGFVGFRLIEQLSQESAEVLEEISESIIADTMTSECVYGDQVVRRCFPARLFRRSMLRVKMGEFRKIEPGCAVEFLQMTLDNMVTYVYMVNPSGKMWLL